MGYTLMNRETCQQCGNPIWICRSKEKNLGFKVRTDVCYASAELEKWQEKRGDKLKKGERPYVVPSMYNDEPLPSRSDYMKQFEE